MAELKDLRLALRDNLLPLRQQGWQVSEHWLYKPTPPSVMIDWQGPIRWHQAMGDGHADWVLIVTAIVDAVDDKGAQERLDRAIATTGDESIKALIESDQTLGGHAEDATCVRVEGPNRYQRDVSTGTQKPPYLGADFVVEIMAA